MILVVLLAIAGILTGGGGILLMLNSPIDPFQLAIPGIVAGAFLLGMAQVIHALIRTAKATEGMLAELRAMRTGEPVQAAEEQPYNRFSSNRI